VDIADWLRRLGLHQYESVFRDNDVDTETLPSLTAEDLRELGITSLGHRKKLLAAIAALSPTLGRLEDDRGPPLAEASPSRPSIKNRPAGYNPAPPSIYSSQNNRSDVIGRSRLPQI